MAGHAKNYGQDVRTHTLKFLKTAFNPSTAQSFDRHGDRRDFLQAWQFYTGMRCVSRDVVCG